MNSTVVASVMLQLYLTYAVGLLQLTSVISAWFAILMPNIIYGVLALAITVIAIGLNFILSGAEAVGLVLLIVYVGAIIILFLFVLMILGGTIIEHRPRIAMLSVPAIILCVLIICKVVFIGWFVGLISIESYHDIFDFSLRFVIAESDLISIVTPDLLALIGQILYDEYPIWIIAIGLLLFIILVGIVLILPMSVIDSTTD